MPVKTPNPSLCLTTPLGIDSVPRGNRFFPFLPFPHAGRFRLRQRLRCLYSDAASRKTGTYAYRRTLQYPASTTISEDLLAEHLTTVQVFNEELGARLALQILYRIKYPNTPHEITYLGIQRAVPRFHR